MRGRLLVAALALVGAACSYQSTYVAPQDGRPRAVWKGNHVEVDHGGVPPTGLCLAQLAWETGSDRIQFADGERATPVPVRAPYAWQPGAAFWVPLWWGLPPPPPLAPGIAPPLPSPPLFVAPHVARRHSLAPVGGLTVPVRPGVGVGAPGVRVSGGGSSSSGSGDLGKALAYLVIVALVVMPIVDVALAVAPAESVSASVRGIDQANALIDLVRVPGSPCSPEAVAASEGAPQ